MKKLLLLAFLSLPLTVHAAPLRVFIRGGVKTHGPNAHEHERFLKDWPGLSAAASQLLKDRGVRVVGSDCLSIDCYGSTDFPAHTILLGADILVGENFANLGRLPPYCFLVALPMAIAAGSGAPTRAVALLGGATPSPVISGDKA